ncbi:hypothetical protein AHAS_Ahas20G0085900 [Arachis hypogaea]
MAVHGSGQQSLTHGGNQQPQACSHTTIFDFCPAITVRYFHCQTSSPPSLVIFSTILSPFLHGLQERSSLLLTPPLSAAALIVTPTNPAIALRLYTTIFHRLLREVVIAANIAFGVRLKIERVKTYSSRTFSHHGPARPLIEAQTQLKHKKESVKKKHPQLHYESNIYASSRRE